MLRDPARRATATAAATVIGVIAASVLPHAGMLHAGFVLDDVPVVAASARLRELRDAPALFGQDWWAGRTRKSLLYRPLPLATFALDVALAVPEQERGRERLPDHRARTFHLHGILWHAVASVLVLLLADALAPGLGLPSSLLFAVHPVHTEAIAPVVGRAELMAAAFGFGALLHAVRRSGGSRAPAAFGGLLLFLALISKESAIVVPLILALAVALGLARLDRAAAIAQGVAVLGYLALRVTVLGTLLGTAAPAATGTPDVDNPLAGQALVTRLLTVGSFAPRIVELLVAPWRLSADYSFDQIPVVTAPTVASVAGILLIAGLLCAAVVLRRSAPVLSFAILAAMAAFLPVSNLPFAIGTIFAERLLYLPSLGACIAVAWLLGRLPARAAAAALALLILAGAARSHERCKDWRSNAELFQATVITSPRSCRALAAHADVLHAQGRDAEACRTADEALAIAPWFWEARTTLVGAHLALAERGPGEEREREIAAAEQQARALMTAAAGVTDDGTAKAAALHALGRVLLAQGRAEQAAVRFAEAERAAPTRADTSSGLGAALVARAGSVRDPAEARALVDEGIEALKRALALDPDDAGVHGNLGVAYWRRARIADSPEARDWELAHAEEHERAALEIRARAGLPAEGLAASRLRIADVLRERGKLVEALAELQRADAPMPLRRRILLARGVLLATLAESAEGEERTRHAQASRAAFQEVLALEPDNPDAHLNLGLGYVKLDREPGNALPHLKRFLELAPGSPLAPELARAVAQMEASGIVAAE